MPRSLLAAPSHVKIPARIISARLVTALLFVWTLGVTVSRTLHRPNDYAEAHWLLDWHLGFVKRGLPGTILSLVTQWFSVQITPPLLTGLSAPLFAVFCATMVLLALRIAERLAWTPAAVATGLVFMSSPFFVMQADVIGYYDTIVVTIGVASAWLLLKGHPWFAALVQVLALLIHEQTLVLGYPLLVLGSLLLHRYDTTTRGRWQRWAALVLPPLAFIGFSLVWQRTTTPEVVAQYGAKLTAAGYIGDNREVWAPQWIFRSFSDSLAAESRWLAARLTDLNVLRGVAPSVITVLCLALEALCIPVLSLEAIALAATCLAPVSMLLVAWDVPRIWTYATLCGVTGLWICSEIIPRRGAARTTTIVAVWATVAHAFAKTPLLDVPFEPFAPALRAMLYAPTLVAAGLLTGGRWSNMPSVMTAADALRDRHPAALRTAIVVGFLLFVTVVLRTAWVGDDAYITFRSIDNLIHGYGFRWNVVERVQPFTHPLWALLLAGPFALTGEAYFTSLIISMVLAFAAVGIFVARIATSKRAAVLALAVFVFSKAFVEYATSGLENPLTTFLLAVFLWTFWSDSRNRRQWLWSLGGLLALNRLDLTLLVLPVLAADAFRSPWRATLRVAATGLWPLAAWEVFSVIYYGFPFPNTAYAKLQTGVGASELLAQGLLYLLDSIAADPVTLLVTLGGVAMAIQERRRGDWPVILGVVLYVVYIVRIGGDFMSGRFLVAPLFCATALLCRRDWDARAPALAPFVAVLVLLGVFATVRPPITSTKETFVTTDEAGMGVGAVADERAYYYRYTGLLRWTREVPLPHEGLMVDAAKAIRGSSEVLATRNIGFFGYFAGPTVHIVDMMALSDPLLARLPAIRPWRIGHFERPVPGGYLESIRSGTNQIADLRIAATYEQMKLVTQGPVWNRRRWRAIRRLNLGW